MKRAILTAAVSLVIACSAHFNEARAVEVVLTGGNAFVNISPGDRTRQVVMNFTAPGMSFSASNSVRETQGGLITQGSIGTTYPNVFIYENSTGSLIYNGVAYKYFSTTFLSTATTWYGTVHVYNTETPVAGGDYLVVSFNFIGSGTRELSGNSLTDGTMRFTVASDTSASEFFVRQHYRDFLNREPDAEGFAFWTGEIDSCGSDAQCREVRRINVSAAFFLSIEFEETGCLVYHFYTTALDRPDGLPGLVEFQRDTQALQRGLVVGAEGWEAKLNANKQAYAEEFVSRAEFLTRYPLSMTPADYVNALYAHAGQTPAEEERQAAVAEFSSAADISNTAARARALGRVAGSEAQHERDVNRAFVLMQYFGYLRRDPQASPDEDLSGYNYWLGKLDSFDGDFIRAEMVKAFIASAEYRSRFGPQ